MNKFALKVKFCPLRFVWFKNVIFCFPPHKTWQFYRPNFNRFFYNFGYFLILIYQTFLYIILPILDYFQISIKKNLFVFKPLLIPRKFLSFFLLIKDLFGWYIYFLNFLVFFDFLKNVKFSHLFNFLDFLYSYLSLIFNSINLITKMNVNKHLINFS